MVIKKIQFLEWHVFAILAQKKELNIFPEVKVRNRHHFLMPNQPSVYTQSYVFAGKVQCIQKNETRG